MIFLLYAIGFGEVALLDSGYAGVQRAVLVAAMLFFFAAARYYLVCAERLRVDLNRWWEN